MAEYHEKEKARDASETSEKDTYCNDDNSKVKDFAAPEGRTDDEAQDYSVFGVHQKRYIVFMAAFASLFSSLSANTYLPALNTLEQKLHVTRELIALTITSYMVFQGLAPTLYGDLADMTGRRPAYIVGFSIYIAANLGLALQKNYAALFILRCLQSTGSSGTIALGNGVVADVSAMTERGTYMGFVVSGTMVGPAIGPVLGGLLSEFLGWRSIFWFLVILAVAYLVPFLVTFPETARHIVGNGSLPPQSWNMSLYNYLQSRKASRDLERDGRDVEQLELTDAQRAQRRLQWPNPLRTISIAMEKDVAIILMYSALVYTAWYDVTTSLPSLFRDIYSFDDLQLGLSFIPYGVGCVVASILGGKFMDLNYKRVAETMGFTLDRRRSNDLKDFPIEKARLQVVWPLLFCGIGALLCYGWVLQFEVHLAAPLILHFVIGLCLAGAYNILCVLLVDLYPQNPATATAVNNLVRCLFAAAGTGLIIRMIDGMGRGWCFTFIAMVLVVTSPVLWVEQRWGAGWREARRVRAQVRQCAGNESSQ